MSLRVVAMRPTCFGLAVAAVVALVSCGGSPTPSATPSLPSVASTPTVAPTSAPAATAAPVLNVYASTMSGQVKPSLRGVPERVYVPNEWALSVTVIDPATFKVIAHIPVGRIPEHVTPSHDMSRLYVNSEGAWTITALDPATATATQTYNVPDAYNLYFTPDGTKAVVVQERLRRLEFRDTHTWAVIKDVPISLNGVDHLDFSADGSYLMVTTEYTGRLVKVDVNTMTVVGEVNVGGLPVDVRLSPDGKYFFVANQGRGGVSVVDPVQMMEVGFIPTGRGAHGFALSRDTKSLYVTNRLENTVSVIDFASRKAVAKWKVPGGGPDMLQLNPAGTQLWLTGRYDGFVSVLDTTTGALLAHIFSGLGAHGLCYFPAPGTISLGHNGVYR